MLKGMVLTAKLDSVNQMSIQPITESKLIMGYLLFQHLANSLNRWLRRIQNLINFYAHLNFSFCSVKICSSKIHVTQI